VVPHVDTSTEAIGLRAGIVLWLCSGCSVRQAHHWAQAVPRQKDAQSLLDLLQDHGPGGEGALTFCSGVQSSAVNLPSHGHVMPESSRESFRWDLFDLQCACAPCLQEFVQACRGMAENHRTIAPLYCLSLGLLLIPSSILDA